MFRKIMVGMVAAGALAIATPSQATTALAIVIDGSGSISGPDFATQKTSYINALNALLPIDGTNAIAVYQFSSTVQTEFAETVIDDAGDLTALTTAIGAMVQLGNQTAIGDAIAEAAGDLIGNGFGDRKIIDVSTDGENNAGSIEPGPAALAAVAGGIDQVNCLGVGGSADCSFIAGIGAFSINAADFSKFEEALNEKLSREIGVPEPASLALLATGLIGAGFAARRRRRRA